MKNQLLLLEDLDPIGRKGEIVSVKPGFARNYLLPQKKAVFANRKTVELQKKLQEEREEQAAVDRKSSSELAEKLKTVVLTTEVKIDQEGKMYGSVAAADILRLLMEQGIEIEKRNLLLSAPLKNIGKHTINLRLKEGVVGSVVLDVIPEGGVLAPPIEEKAPKKKKRKSEEQEEGETPSE